MGGRFFISILLLAWAPSVRATSDAAAREQQAREQLAQKLTKLSKLESMREDKFDESKGGGGKVTDANAGTPFSANTTYHKNVWDECMDWVGGQYCNKWLTAYVSKHGFGGDYSPLEQLVAQEWKKRAGVDTGKTFEIWEIQRDGGGSNTDVDGKLERQGISKWELLPGVKRKIDSLGYDYAGKQLQLTYDEGAPKQGVLPNIESMRVMAARYTKIYRNNLMANLGELRANDKQVEFALNEDMPNCEAYRKAMRKYQEDTRTEERLKWQARLQPETRVLELQERYQMCVQLRNASYDVVNAQVKGKKVGAGDVEQEQYDKMAARINIALIDRAGLNPNAMPKPSNVAFKKSQYSNDIMDYNYGGSERGIKRESNAEQLMSYNNVLENAAAGMDSVVARAGGTIPTDGGDVRKFKIGLGTRSAIEINGLTNEMRGELANTSFASTTTMKRAPKVENAPSQLTVKAAR